jgi:hypothetical protein
MSIIGKVRQFNRKRIKVTEHIKILILCWKFKWKIFIHSFYASWDLYVSKHLNGRKTVVCFMLYVYLAKYFYFDKHMLSFDILFLTSCLWIIFLLLKEYMERDSKNHKLLTILRSK